MSMKWRNELITINFEWQNVRPQQWPQDKYQLNELIAAAGRDQT